MRWQGERRSSNVEDRRGRIPGGGIALGGGGLLLVLLAVLFGADPRQVLEQLGGGNSTESVEAPRDPAEDAMAEFVSVVLAETEDVWNAEFQKRGKAYREPTLVLFTERVESACGLASQAMGPFYCPGDEKVYIDLAFYQMLRDRFQAPGDFAQAYVIAHEVGHHVQNLLGISDQVAAMRERLSQEEYNQLSVRLELQADFLAGVWAHHTEQLKQNLEPGDIEEALNAATAIGDDRLQMESQGYVVPDAFTHGTSEQRLRWFRRGYESGDLEDGDTFAADEL
ncbi:MAG: neutral zinc metallopeptidase [Candidatus Eisenbacteria bacterium]